MTSFPRKGPPSARRVSAIIELQSRVTLTFIRHTLHFLKLWTSNGDVEEHVGSETWRDDVKAFEFAEQLIRRLAVSGAPMLIVWTGWQLVVIERNTTTQKKVIKLKVHECVLAQPGPVPSAEPVDAQAQALCAEWNVLTERSLASNLALLAIRADRIPQTMDQSFRPCSGPKLAFGVSASAQDEVASSTHKRKADSQANSGRYAPYNSTSIETWPEAREELPVSALIATHVLLHHHYPFTQRSRHQLHHACLVPSGQAHCASLLALKSHRPEACPQPGHLRVIAKTPCPPRPEEEETWAWEEELGPAERAVLLEEEAGLFQMLQFLQGSVLPVYYGKWGDEESALHVYEDFGITVSLLLQAAKTYA